VTSRWPTLALVTLAHALGALTALAVAPLAPFLLESLRLSRAQVGYFLPAVYLGGVLMALPAGWLTDRLGVRLTLVLGQLLVGAMIALAAASPNLVVLLTLLVLGGFGFSVLNPATGKAVVEWFPPRERGMAMGIKQTGLTLGGLAAALVLPSIALAWSWRHALAAAGTLSLVSAALVAVLYRRRRSPLSSTGLGSRSSAHSSGARRFSSSSAAGSRSRSRSPRSWPSWCSTRRKPSPSPRCARRSSWPWRKSAGRPAASCGAWPPIAPSAAGAARGSW